MNYFAHTSPIVTISAFCLLYIKTASPSISYKSYCIIGFNRFRIIEKDAEQRYLKDIYC